MTIMDAVAKAQMDKAIFDYRFSIKQLYLRYHPDKCGGKNDSFIYLRESLDRLNHIDPQWAKNVKSLADVDRMLHPLSQPLLKPIFTPTWRFTESPLFANVPPLFASCFTFPTPEITKRSLEQGSTGKGLCDSFMIPPPKRSKPSTNPKVYQKVKPKHKRQSTTPTCSICKRAKIKPTNLVGLKTGICSKCTQSKIKVAQYQDYLLNHSTEPLT